MSVLSEPTFTEISQLLQQYFLSPLQERMAHAEEILKAVAQSLEKSYASADHFAEHKLTFRAELMAIATSEQAADPAKGFAGYYPLLQQKLDDFIAQQQAIIVSPQQEARFAAQPKDAAWLRKAKFWKRRLLRLDQFSQNTTNWLRNALGSEEKQLTAWTHKVPWQLLLRQHLQVQLVPQLQELVDLGQRQQHSFLQSAAELSTLPNRQPAPARIEILQEIEQRLQGAHESRRQADELLERQLQAILGRLFTELKEDYHKAGTLELPARKLKPELLKKKQLLRQQQIEVQLHEWQNARLALTNHWQLQLQLQTAADQLQQQFLEARRQWQQGLQTQLLSAIKKVSQRLAGIKKTLAVNPLPSAFTESRQQLRHQLARQEVADAAKALLELDLPGQLQALEPPLQQILAALPAHSLLGPQPGQQEPAPLPDAALSAIQIRELLSLETLPLAMRKLLQLRTEVQQQVEEIKLRLGEMEEMSLFSLDAAHAYWEQHPQDEQKACAIAFEGLDRTMAHAEALQERLVLLSTVSWQELDQLLLKISNNLLAMSNLENVKNLQMRLFKARARQRSKSFQQQASKRLQDLLPQAQHVLQQSLSFAGKQQQRLRSRLGIQAPPAAIASELSDFLAENEQALARLPFTYQRLYNTAPLSDELFLIGRSSELQALQQGYHRWVAGKFSPMLISAEKGSGTTSLINIFLRRIPQQQQVARITLAGGTGNLSDLATALAGALGVLHQKTPEGTSSAPDWQELQNYLMRPAKPLVLVVEDLQHLFRRWVGGFEVMKAFLELVSLSSKSVFWVCSCTIYSWQYLDRVIFASETWGSVLFLQNFSPAQLNELIMRRQRVSGYLLHYEPSVADLQNKKFLALTEAQQQTYLEQKYFQKLSLFAQSNLRLALLYWLRSTQSVTKNSVVISTSLNPEFGFLQTMPAMRYFILHALLLHDRLQPAELALILGESETSLRRQLQMLSDDGLLLRQQEGYSINPLLYRQIVNVLKLKNLVH